MNKKWGRKLEENTRQDNEAIVIQTIELGKTSTSN